MPVVVDATSCTEALADLLGQEGITVVDAISFAEATLLPRLPSPRCVQSIVVHPTCSTTRFGLNTVLMRLAAATAWEVVQPEDWHCCAFAGDRGLLHPELTAAATAAEARSVLKVDATAFVSANRTCELGMTRATGRPFRHLLEVLDDVTRQRDSKR